MIRFLCPNCSRRYELPEALARLPLVCKGCGQPFAVPESSTEPEVNPEPPKPAPPKVVAPPPPPKPEPPKVVAPPTPPQPAPLPRPVTVAAVENRLPLADHPHSNGQPAAYPKNGPLFEQPEVLESLEIAPPAPVAVARPANRKVTAAVVDGIVAIILLAIGVFCGELLARHSTSEVLRDAGSAAKFPPLDFLMWLAPPLLFLLIYSLLISRGKSVGRWLARRSDT